MAQRMAVPGLILILVGSTVLAGQNPAPSSNFANPEFPVVLQQGITAGKTPVGTKIQAKLLIATLVNGTVVPKNAIFSGEVTESVAKTTTEPSRLSIRMDLAQWKNGSAPLKAYFNGWYYPTVEEVGQDVQYGPQQPAQRTWNGQGQYPDPNSRSYKPFPGSDSDKGSSVPDTPSSVTAKNRALMKDIEVGRDTDGTIVLLCKRANIKLEKYATYVVSTEDAQQK